jgi:hypothetical protein
MENSASLWSLSFRVKGLGFRDASMENNASLWSLSFRVQDLGFRV